MRNYAEEVEVSAHVLLLNAQYNVCSPRVGFSKTPYLLFKRNISAHVLIFNKCFSFSFASRCLYMLCPAASSQVHTFWLIFLTSVEEKEVKISLFLVFVFPGRCSHVCLSFHQVWCFSYQALPLLLSHHFDHSPTATCSPQRLLLLS